MQTDVVLDALNMAVAQRKPTSVIHHSDHGCQHTSLAFGRGCREVGVRPSRGSVGDAYDNAMCESFYREPRVRAHRPTTLPHARRGPHGRLSPSRPSQDRDVATTSLRQRRKTHAARRKRLNRPPNRGDVRRHHPLPREPCPVQTVIHKDFERRARLAGTSPRGPRAADARARRGAFLRRECMNLCRSSELASSSEMAYASSETKRRRGRSRSRRRADIRQTGRRRLGSCPRSTVIRNS